MKSNMLSAFKDIYASVGLVEFSPQEQAELERMAERIEEILEAARKRHQKKLNQMK